MIIRDPHIYRCFSGYSGYYINDLHTLLDDKFLDLTLLDISYKLTCFSDTGKFQNNKYIKFIKERAERITFML